MFELFDTHCHIQSVGSLKGERATQQLWAKAGEKSAEDILARAKEAGVKTMMCVGCDLNDSQLAIDFVKSRENLYASIGIHPHEADRYAGKSRAKQEFANLAVEPKVKAVGECGLDYFYEHSHREAQKELLKFQIELALEHNLPLIFHVRDTSSAQPGNGVFDDFWPILDSYDGIRGVLHSFTDTKENLDKAIERGLYIGVNGIATFAKQAKQLEMYRKIPLEKLVLETDAPFLTPVPYRGNICEPYHVSTTANFLKELREEELETLAKATTSNAKQLFGVS
jgi:TatD DNase family protein